jgi:hypothetical protein
MLTTAQRAENVYEHADMLNSLITAGKISFATENDHDPSGLMKLLVSRATNMTPEEEAIAADMKSLAEDINTLRGPLGATGFRGADAFAALQAQRGNLMARPGVTKGVLKNSLENMVRQMAVQHRALSTAGIQFPPSSKADLVKFYKTVYGDPKVVMQKLREDGY